MTEEELLRFTVVSFSGKLIFNGVQGHFYASIKISIFKTLRRLTPESLTLKSPQGCRKPSSLPLSSLSSLEAPLPGIATAVPRTGNLSIE